MLPFVLQRKRRIISNLYLLSAQPTPATPIQPACPGIAPPEVGTSLSNCKDFVSLCVRHILSYGSSLYRHAFISFFLSFFLFFFFSKFSSCALAALLYLVSKWNFIASLGRYYSASLVFFSLSPSTRTLWIV